MIHNENDRFRPPRYRITCESSNYIGYIDTETGLAITVYDARNARRRKNANIQLGFGSAGIEQGELGSHHTNDLLNIAGEVIKIIVGITIATRFSRIGAHTFVMYINEPNNPEREWRSEIWGKDVMLDAAGSFGIGVFRSAGSDIVVPGEQPPSPISVDRYRRWFHQQEGETLYTYTYLVEKETGRRVRNLILEHERRSPPGFCAIVASSMLQRSGLFTGIRRTPFPANIKRFLDRYTPTHKNIMKLDDKSAFYLGDLNSPAQSRM